MEYRFHHVHLLCRDLDNMIGFFSETLGASLVEKKKFGTADGAVLDLDGVTVNLRVARDDEKMLETPSGKPYGYDHIGLEVDDTQKAYEELTAKGFTFSIPPRDTGSFVVAFFQGGRCPCQGHRRFWVIRNTTVAQPGCRSPAEPGGASPGH